MEKREVKEKLIKIYNEKIKDSSSLVESTLDTASDFADILVRKFRPYYSDSTSVLIGVNGRDYRVGLVGCSKRVVYEMEKIEYDNKAILHFVMPYNVYEIGDKRKCHGTHDPVLCMNIYQIDGLIQDVPLMFTSPKVIRLVCVFSNSKPDNANHMVRYKKQV